MLDVIQRPPSNQRAPGITAESSTARVPAMNLDPERVPDWRPKSSVLIHGGGGRAPQRLVVQRVGQVHAFLGAQPPGKSGNGRFSRAIPVGIPDGLGTSAIAFMSLTPFFGAQGHMASVTYIELRLDRVVQLSRKSEISGGDFRRASH